MFTEFVYKLTRRRTSERADEQTTTKMLIAKRSSSCRDLGLTEKCNTCDELDKKIAHGEKIRKGAKFKCEQPWKWNIKPGTHHTRRLKTAKIVDKICERGYTFFL